MLVIWLLAASAAALRLLKACSIYARASPAVWNSATSLEKDFFAASSATSREKKAWVSAPMNTIGGGRNLGSLIKVQGVCLTWACPHYSVRHGIH